MKIYEMDASFNIKSLVDQGIHKDHYLKCIVDEDLKIYVYDHIGGEKKRYYYTLDGNALFFEKVVPYKEECSEGVYLRSRTEKTIKYRLENNEIYRFMPVSHPKDPSEDDFVEMEGRRRINVILTPEEREHSDLGDLVYNTRSFSIDKDLDMYKILEYRIKNNNEIYAVHKEKKTDTKCIETHTSTIKDNVIYFEKGKNKITGAKINEPDSYFEEADGLSFEQIILVLKVASGLGTIPKDSKDLDLDDVEDAAKDLAKKGLGKLKGLFGKKNKDKK